MLSFRSLMLALAVFATLPIAAQAQPARNGNVYDGTAHQPTGGVQSEEKSAGVAPSPQASNNENRELGSLNQQLLDKAHQDAKTAPQVGNLYGTQQGGVVQITPSSGK